MLHLTAFDAEDLGAISAQMQDAVLPYKDMKWVPARKQFALVANRYAWDALPERQRRRSGLHFNYVKDVKRAGPSGKVVDSVLSLLAITFTPDAGEGAISGTIMLEFSGGHRIALTVECVDAQLDDLGPAWSTEHEPQHEG